MTEEVPGRRAARSRRPIYGRHRHEHLTSDWSSFNKHLLPGPHIVMVEAVAVKIARSSVTPRPAVRVLATVHQAEPLISVCTRIPKALRRRVRHYCANHGVAVQQFIADAIRERLRAQRRRPH